ncbi:MAG: hypothetical protein KH501_01280 [Eubacterium limosum]|nr:hypothetical protein [Eubacterium limosum]
MKEKEFCECKNSSSCYSEMDDFGFWYICCDCGKVIEDTYEYFNQVEDDFM